MSSPKLGLRRVAAGLALVLAVPTSALLVISSPAAAAPAAATTPSALLRWQGDVSSATGSALSNGVCDVDGDGYDDFVAGAWFWDKGATANIGAAYVVLGDAAINGAALASPGSAHAVRIDGPSVANSFVGFAVSCLGDVNGDGLDDIAISHYTAQKVYVVFGNEHFTSVDLGSLGDRGFVVKGDSSSGNVGYSFSRLGDVNGDHRDDFGVAEIGADTQGRTNNGRIWVIAGRDDISDVDLTAPAAGAVLATIDGASNEERLGVAAQVGDVNGDGSDDILLGSYTATPWGSSIAVPGAAYVVWGGGPAEIDLAALGDNGFTIAGPKRQRDRLGVSVSGVGDLNDDGRADLLVGADGVTNAVTGSRNGGAAVVYGSASTARVYTDPTAVVTVYTCDNDPGTGTCAAPADQRSRGYWINGAVGADSAGYSVAGLPDVDGDGRPDLLIGAYGYDPVNPATPGTTMSGAGAAYVVYGRDASGLQSLADLDTTGSTGAGYRLDGTAAGDRFGRQVAGIGDLDGNGVADIAVGADFANRGGAQAGEITVGLLGALSTSTALTVAPTPASGTTTVGDTVTLTATVAQLAGAGTPTGSVTFTDGGTDIASCADVVLVAGTASCDYQLPGGGDLTLGADYAGTPTHAASSDTGDVTVAKLSSSTTLDVTPTGSVTRGTPLTLTAAVDGGATSPTGSVSFTAGGTTITDCSAVALADGAASCTYTPVSAGDVTLAATYGGSAVHLASAADTTVTVTAPSGGGGGGGGTPVVEPKPTTTSLAASPTAATVGDDLTLTATVAGADGAGATPTGTVHFTAGGTTLAGCGEIALTDGTATCAYNDVTAGSHALSVSYGGSTDHLASAASVHVDVLRHATTVTVPASSAIGYGKPVTIRAEVASDGTAPTGEVSFRAGESVVGTAQVSSGVATLTVPARALEPGTTTVVVDYAGDETHAPATATGTVVVRRAASTTTLTIGKIAGTHGRLRAIVQVRSDDVTLTGTVQVKVDGKVARRTTVDASGSRARIPLPKLAKGRHTVRALFAGSDHVAPSQSTTMTVKVR